MRDVMMEREKKKRRENHEKGLSKEKIERILVWREGV